VLGLVPSDQALNNLVSYFQNFHHPAYQNSKNVWSLESVPLLREFIFAVHDDDRIALVNSIIDAFETEVVSVFDSLAKGICYECKINILYYFS
jgi:hypothetical protein